MAIPELKIVRTLVLLFCSSMLLLGCQSKNELPYYNKADLIPQWEKPGTNAHTIENFEFQNHRGEKISNANMSGKIAVVNFFFATCPGVCPRMMNNLMPLQEKMKGDTSILILSHSVTPWKDSVAALQQYASRTGIDNPSWHLLTGNRTEIYRLARHSYFAEEEPGLSKDSSQFLHTEWVFLLDGEGLIRGVYKGTVALDMQHMLEDIELLKGEASY